MGTVFTLEDVERRRVPSTEDLQRAVELLKSRLRANPGIIAALLYGSVVRGDSDRRSDIDCVVVFDVNHTPRVHAALQEIIRGCAKMHIKTDFVVTDDLSVERSAHRIGPGFTNHLQNSARDGGTIKGEVRSYLKPTISVEGEAFSYVQNKLRYLEELDASYSSSSNVQKAEYLKKVLAAPKHVALKVAAMRGPLANDSKRAVIAHYTELAPPGLLKQFTELVALDEWYSTELEAQMQKFDKARYGACLRRIEAAIQNTIAFVRANALLIDSLITEGQITA